MSDLDTLLRALDAAKLIHVRASDRFGHAVPTQHVFNGAMLEALGMLAKLLLQQSMPTTDRPTTPLNDAYRFDDGLVERLATVFSDAVRFELQTTGSCSCGPASGIRAILSELAKAPMGLPSADDILQTWYNDSTRGSELVAAMLREKFGPVLAAKDARIAELESENSAYRQRAARGDKTIAELGKRLTELTAPISVEGKTPGQVDHDARHIEWVHRGFASLTWDELTRDGQEVSCVGAQAVLRAFGGEALRNVRKQAQVIETHFVAADNARREHTAKGAIRDFVRIIDSELAKLGAP